jgi:hypothetical protein
MARSSNRSCEKRPDGSAIGLRSRDETKSSWRRCPRGLQFDEARSYLGEAITAAETTKEKWSEDHCIGGEIALMSPERAETCFERALTVARAQQAKFWELRAAMSMARL